MNSQRRAANQKNQKRQNQTKKQHKKRDSKINTKNYMKQK